MQDPVVFSGTVRDNLDPFNASPGDAAIWSALRQTGMADVVTSLQVRLPCSALPSAALSSSTTKAEITVSLSSWIDRY